MAKEVFTGIPGTICVTHKEDGGMSFRDLHAFNLALLAKHGWKFLTKPHTLVAQIYKAKYFPTTNFLEATLGSNPSFTWRSVWMAKSILVRGCRWRVGKGNEINMWNSPWLRNLPSNMLQTSPPPGTENLKVCNIITENRTWNMELMRMMLCYSDIE